MTTMGETNPSRAGRMVVEVRARSPFDSVPDVAPGEAVEARMPTGTRLGLLINGAVMAPFMFLGAWFGFGWGVWARWMCVAGGLILTAQEIAGVLTYNQPRARVDDDGVTGYPSHRALWPRFVAWSDVFGCEVTTIHDNLGRPIIIRPALKGRHGETLMELYLINTPIDEQERIVDAIKARLPEVEVGPRPE